MNSARIKALADFISLKDNVLDVGCDHGYLSIYLKQNNLCTSVLASDISASALEMAKKNFAKYEVDVKSYVSDGFDKVDAYFDTAVIAGMGTTTILHILDNPKCPNKLIISSHNDLFTLRKSLNKMGFQLEKETVILEKGHYYSIMLWEKGSHKLKHAELLFGISKNKDYYLFLYKKNKELLKKVPWLKRGKLKYLNYLLKGLIEKK